MDTFNLRNRWWCLGFCMAGLLVGCGGGDPEDIEAVEGEAAAAAIAEAEREHAELIAEIREQVKAEMAAQNAAAPSASATTTPAPDTKTPAPASTAATTLPPAPAASAPASNAPPTTRSTPPAAAANHASDGDSEAGTTSTSAGISGGNPGGEGGPIAFRAHTIQDQTGMAAASILVPQGWKLEASVIRQPQHLPRTFALADILVSAPDDREFHMYPNFQFVYSNMMQAQPFQPVDGGLFLPPPESIGQWLLQMYQLEPDPTVTNLRIASEEEYAPLTQQLRQLAAPTYQGMQQMQASAQPGDQMGFDTQGTKIVFQYDKDGKPKEETFIAGWQIMVFQYGQLGMTGAHWGVYNMRSISGPVGTDYMNDPALVTIAQSFQTTPQWNDAMAKFYRSIAPKPNPRQPMPSTSSTVAQTNSDVLDIMHKGWKSNDTLRDAGQASSVNMIHERTAYADPNAVGGTVNLSSHYNNVLTDGQNNYLMHNDANWNANTDPNFNNRNWQTLPPQQ